MKMAFICTHILCGKNRTQFQRAFYLSRNYSVWLFSRNKVCEEVAEATKDVVYCPGKRLGIPKLLFPFWAAYRVYRLHKRCALDIVYTSPHPQALITGFLARKIGILWVADIWDAPSLGFDLGVLHGVPHRKLVRAYHQFLLQIVRRILPKADLILIAMDPEVLSYFGVYPQADNVFVVTNGVNLHITRPGGEVVDAKPDKFRIVYVGPVQKTRGIDVILKAAELLLAEGLNFELELVGPILAEEKAWIDQVLERTGLNQCTTLTGAVPHAEALRRIAGADVCLCILPLKVLNYRYAYPIKLFEYMAMGKPIVCTRMKGTERIIQDGETGLLVPPDDPHALAEAILKLYCDPDLRRKLGQNARQAAVNYDWEKINAQIVERIAQLLERSSG